MKKSLLFLSGLISSLVMAAMPISLGSEEQQKIEFNKEAPILTQPSSRPRTVTHLEAYYDSSLNIIEIHLEGLGDCNISLLDESGNVVVQTMAYSNNYSIETLELLGRKGQYTLVIDSDAMYAYGTFYVE